MTEPDNRNAVLWERLKVLEDERDRLLSLLAAERQENAKWREGVAKATERIDAALAKAGVKL